MVAGVNSTISSNLQSYGLSEAQVKDMYDKNKDGKIDEKEQAQIEAAFKNEKSYDMFDKNKDGKIDMDEYEYMNKMLSTIDKQMEQYDKDGSYTLDRQESEDWSKQWAAKCNGKCSGGNCDGKKPFQVNVDNVFSAYDLDKSGDLDYFEMLSMYMEYDTDGDGELSAEEAMAMDEALAAEGFTEDGEATDPAAGATDPAADPKVTAETPPPPPAAAA